MVKIHLQTDADGVIWRKNLLLSLGEGFVYDLIKRGQYKNAFGKLSQLVIHYFLSKPVDKTHLAFVPFRDCPMYLLANQYRQRIQDVFKRRMEEAKTIYRTTTLNLRVVSEDVKFLIEGYKRQYSAEFDELGLDIVDIVANKDFNQNHSKINSKNKIMYLDPKIPYIGDKREIKAYGHLENFILVTESLYKPNIKRLLEENNAKEPIEESLLECKI